MADREKTDKEAKGASMNIQNKQLFDTIKEEAYDVWRRL